VLLALSTAPLAAQATGTVRGRVVEAGAQRPLAGAQVSVPGTGRGGLTDASGSFVLLNVPAGTIRVRGEMIGFAPVEREVTVTAGQVATVELALSQAAISLNEIVVTGTPGAVQKKTLGNAVATINAADLTQKAANTTVTELLQAKAPGIQIIGGSGSAGTGASIRIRGASSLNAGNRPVFYVDGVKVSTARGGNFAASCCNQDNGQNTSLLDLLNPDDIESIEVIKGPAAATLYGAEAAGGVIQIITKKGRPGQQKMQWNAKLGMGQSEWALETITNYAQCTAAKLANPSVYPGCVGKAEGAIISGQPLKTDPDALRAGDLRQYALSVRGGGEGYSFYLSGDINDEEGIFHNNFSNRKSGRANFAFAPTGELDIAVSVGYSQQHVRLPIADEHAQGMLFGAARSEPGRLYAAPGGLGWSQRTPDLINRFDNQTRSERTVMSTTVNYRPFTWFANRLTVGVDAGKGVAEIFYAPFDPAKLGPDSGFIAQRTPDTHIYTLDYAGTINQQLSESLSSSFGFGMQFNAARYKTLYAEGRGLGSSVTRTISSAAVTAGAQTYSESNSLGFFAQEQVGWRDRLFVTAGLRMDNNSVFGTEIKQIFYPKLSASYVISEESFFNLPYVDNLRLRASWGQAGNAPGAYAATRTFTSSVATLADGTTVPALRNGAYGNPDLKPERGEEIEFGFDAALLNNRAGIELTYYAKHMRDGLLYVPIPPSSGFSGSVQKNLLETKNSGLELSINGTPVEGRAVTWESRLNLATNSNELVSFGDGRAPQKMGLYAAVQRHQPGYPLAGYWGRDVQRDADGKPKLNASNQVLIDTADVYVGPSTPTREVSFSNTVTLFGNLRLYALLDYKGGHYMFNVTDWYRTRNDLTYEMLDPNTPAVDKQILKNGSVTLPWIQQADFLKLRDVTVAYTLPTRFSRRFGSNQTSFAITGHNMALLWTRYGGIDPEVNLHGDAEFLRAQAYTVPMTRRITASLNVSF
jgi:TonB-linked SusC/RagA family outer membrane protein